MSLAEIIDTTDGCAKYDSCAKKLISHKAVLAWILKYCAKEFASYSIEYIRDHCIEGDAEISSEAVHQDMLNTKAESSGEENATILPQKKSSSFNIGHGGAGRIHGMNTEDKSIKEGTVHYDIRFSACFPGEKKPIHLFINLEIQQNTNPGYPLVKRGFYYCSRMISSQYGTVFENEHYEKLRKVYSIWICPKPAKKAANKIRRYRTIEEFPGEEAPCLPNGENIPLPPEGISLQAAYDLMEVVILYPSEDGKNNDRNDVLHLLNILFSNKISPGEKKSILQNKYHIAMEKNLEEDVNNMCNLSAWVWNDGRESGFTEGHESGLLEGQERGRMEERLNAIRRMQESLMLTVEQAMDVLGISKEERNVYLNLLI